MLVIIIRPFVRTKTTAAAAAAAVATATTFITTRWATQDFEYIEWRLRFISPVQPTQISQLRGLKLVAVVVVVVRPCMLRIGNVLS